ncbi:MAG: HAD family hydrolase [Candidatus Woesearchaeota archaeon]
MIKLIISDIGGVLLKTDEAIITCIETVFKKHAIPTGSKENLLKAFGESIYDYIRNYVPKEHLDKVDMLYEDYKKIYPEKVLNLIKPYEEINETLENLQKKGYAVAILSCMIRKEVDANLNLLRFKDFTVVYSLEDYSFKRPHPQGLQSIMKMLNMRPEETIYIGDTVNDIKMAKNANIISIAVKTGAQDNQLLEKEKPDFLISSFKDIPLVLNKLNTQ